ncbi:MAG: hypothetical protein ACQES5_04100 [Thermodesulfobacteriota bacterium]
MSEEIDLILKQQKNVRAYLSKIAENPPSVLLLEGGKAKERMAMALYWAAALNCAQNPPCLACPACVQIKETVHRDLFIIDCDGLKVEQLRNDIRPKFNQTAHHNLRLVIFANAQFLHSSCANMLLKSLEEPGTWTRFVILAPLRTNIIPTLVSRSFVFTLSRSIADNPETIDNQNAEIFLIFCRTGKGWLDISSRKNSVDRDMAIAIISRVEQDLLYAAKGKNSVLPVKTCNEIRNIQQILNKSVHCLDMLVNPAVVLDWMGSSIYSMLTTNLKSQGNRV